MTDVHLRFGELDPDDVRLYPAGPDSGGGGVTYTRSTSDLARAADTLSRTLSAVRGTADLARAVDTLTRALVAARSTTDTARAVEALTRAVVLARLLTDTAPATDTVARARLRTRLLFDSAPASDTVAAFMLLLTRARLQIGNRPLTGLVVEVESCPSA